MTNILRNTQDLETYGGVAAGGVGGSNVYVNAVTTNAQSFTTATPAVITTWTTPNSPPNQNVGGLGVTPPLNLTTGVFTAPNPGVYSVSAMIKYASNAAGAAGELYQLLLQRQPAAGGGFSTIAQSAAVADSTTAAPRAVQISTTIALAAGDQLQLEGSQNSGSAVALTAAAADNQFSINQIA